MGRIPWDGCPPRELTKAAMLFKFRHGTGRPVQSERVAKHKRARIIDPGPPSSEELWHGQDLEGALAQYEALDG